jgi:hypothetical protein
MVLTPTSPTELRETLRRGVTQFAFKKLDGTLRTAVGTTNLSSIPTEMHPKGIRQSSPNAVVFFDIEKREWRSVSVRQEMFIFR